MPRRFLKNRERAMLELVVEVATIARDEAAGAVVKISDVLARSAQH